MDYSRLLLSSTRRKKTHNGVSQCGLRKEDIDTIEDFDIYNVKHKKRSVLGLHFSEKRVRE